MNKEGLLITLAILLERRSIVKAIIKQEAWIY